MQEGFIDVDLGGNVIKQRISRPGQGKSGGYRIIVVFKAEERAFLVYGFAKSRRENIDKSETVAFKKAAKELLSLTDMQIKQLLENGALVEIE